MKPQSRRDDTRDRKDLHLAEVLDFRPDQGIIRLHQQRVVILSAAAMGLLRKELIDTLGLETARRVLLRFGFADGYHDAVNLRERSRWTDPVEGLRAGACFTRWRASCEPTSADRDDAATGRFEEEVVWHDSYEAEQHVHHYGKARTRLLVPGRVLERLRQRVPGQGGLFSRDGVRRAGRKHVSAIGRDAKGWGEEIERFAQIPGATSARRSNAA